MEAKIRAYIQWAFAGIPSSQKAEDLKEEMILNLIEKYHDRRWKDCSSG